MYVGFAEGLSVFSYYFLPLASVPESPASYMRTIFQSFLITSVSVLFNNKSDKTVVMVVFQSFLITSGEEARGMHNRYVG